MKRIKIRCARCGRNLFFILPKEHDRGSPTIEIQCERDRCKAINIIDYQNPNKLVVRIKE